MANIHWANGVSGNWTTAANWTGDVVPGIADTAYIDASGAYIVTLGSTVKVGGVVLNDSIARLGIGGSLTTQLFQLEAGELRLSNGSLSGTYSQGAGSLTMTNGTLNNVTWEGVLNPLGPSLGSTGTLTISNGLTLTGANGSGAGSLTFNITGNHSQLALVLNDVASLNNATISLSATATVENTPTLTLGAGLTVNGGGLQLATGETVVNDGRLNGVELFNGGITNNGIMSGVSVSGGSITDNGTIYGGYFLSTSLTNNGTITSGGDLVIDTASLRPPGANGVILLESGDLSLVGTLTTAQLMALYQAQHISGTGTFGFGLISGALDNSGATLDFGQGTTLGELAMPDLFGTLKSFAPGTITGGTIIEHDTGTATIGGGAELGLDSLTIQSAAATLTLTGIDTTGVNITGASTIDATVDSHFNDDFNTISGGTLSGVGTLNDYGGLTLNGVDITGEHKHGKVTINMSGEGFLDLGAGQSTAGYTINVLNSDSTIGLADGVIVSNAAVALESKNVTLQVASNASATFAASSAFHISGTGNIITFIGGGDSNFINDANIHMNGDLNIGGTYDSGVTLTNNGTITITTGTFLTGGAADQLINNGVISVNGGGVQLYGTDHIGDFRVTNGNLTLVGALTVASLTQVKLSHGQEFLAGTLDLGGQSLTLGHGGVPLFGLTDADGGYNSTGITDGTLTIDPGTTLTCTSDGCDISAGLVNNGAVVISDGFSGEVTYTLAGSVSGAGTISLSGSAGYGPALVIGAAFGAKQTLQFLSSSPTQVDLGTAAAQSGFAGTLEGFAVNDSIVFTNADIIGGSFIGDSIVATLAGGGTIALATSSALTGTLTATEQFGNGTLTFASSPTLTHGQDNGAAAARSGAVPQADAGHGGADWVVPVHVF